MLVRLPGSITGSHLATEWAASNGHLHVMKWIHSRNCMPVDAADTLVVAAVNHGHLDVVKWLHSNFALGIVGSIITLGYDWNRPCALQDHRQV